MGEGGGPKLPKKFELEAKKVKSNALYQQSLPNCHLTLYKLSVDDVYLCHSIHLSFLFCIQSLKSFNVSSVQLLWL